jgi:REP element-mobilizing transposase RayT
MKHEPGSTLRPDPLAFFFTWTTYGSWLPGDARGWADDRGRLRDSCPPLAHHAASLLRQPRVVLAPADRLTVAAAIREHCRFRGWELHAVNCRTMHVHAVVSAVNCGPETVLQRLKAWCSRQLSEHTGRRVTWWSRGGSTRQLFDMRGIENAMAYVIDGQDGRRE